MNHTLWEILILIVGFVAGWFSTCARASLIATREINKHIDKINTAHEEAMRSVHEETQARYDKAVLSFNELRAVIVKYVPELESKIPKL